MKHFRSYWPLILIVVSVLFVHRNLKVVTDASLSYSSKSNIKIGEGENVPRDDSQVDIQSIQGLTADGYSTNTGEKHENFTINNASSSSSSFHIDNNSRVVEETSDSEALVKGPLIFDRTTGWQGYHMSKGITFVNRKLDRDPGQR